FAKVYKINLNARKRQLKLCLSTEILIIRILNPLIYNAFVAKITQNFVIWNTTNNLCINSILLINRT
ncbi:MAG: hypothetical protein WAN95_00490, partial [Bacteroidales bacterium]